MNPYRAFDPKYLKFSRPLWLEMILSYFLQPLALIVSIMVFTFMLILFLQHTYPAPHDNLWRECDTDKYLVIDKHNSNRFACKEKQ